MTLCAVPLGPLLSPARVQGVPAVSLPGERSETQE